MWKGRCQLVPSVRLAAARRLISRRGLCTTSSDDDRERMLFVANARADRLLANGDHAEGVALLSSVVAGLKELRGERHPDTISSTAYYAQQLIKHSEDPDDESHGCTLAREAYDTACSLLGAAHPETRLVGSTLGQVLHSTGQHAEAETVLRAVHAAATAAEGDDRATTELQVTSSNLAQALLAQGRPREAAPYARAAVRLSIEIHGTHHNATLDEMAGLGSLLEEAGEYDEAEEVFRREVDTLREAHGAAHPDTLVALSKLSRCLASREDDLADSARLVEAEGLMREDLALSREAHGDTHADTLAAISNLAQVLYRREKYAEAVEMAHEGVALSSQLFGTSHEHTLLMRHIAGSAEQRSATTANVSLLLLSSWPPPGDAWALPQARAA